MSACHPFRPVPGQCGPNRRGPLPAPPFDPRDYWATRKCVSRLSASLGTKLDKADVVDPGAEAEAGQAAGAKSTYGELNRILGVASDARVLAESKADKATTLAGYGITDAATKAELDDKADLVGGKVPASQLPSYVDDVLEYDTMSAFPASGESSKIYVAKDTNLVYRWSGTQYVEISPSPALDDTVTETSPNGVKSSGIWSWVKSLLPQWLTSDYAEPATVESVENKRDKTDLAVYDFTEWSGVPTGYYIKFDEEFKWAMRSSATDAMVGATVGSETDLRVVFGADDWSGGYEFTATRSTVPTFDTLAKKSELTAGLANKRDKTDLAVYGFTEWTFAPALPDGYEIGYRDESGGWGVYYNGELAGAVKGSYYSLEISWDGNEWNGGYPFTATRSCIQTADTLATTNGVNAAIEAHHDGTKRDLADNTCHKTEFTEWSFSGEDYDPTATYEMFFKEIGSASHWELFENGEHLADSQIGATESDTKVGGFEDYHYENPVNITATRSVVCTDGEKFVTSDVIDGKVSSAVSTNNPAFVSAVRNTPTSGMPEDMPTDWGTYGTVGAALAALAAGLKWIKNILGSVASGYSTFAEWIASKYTKPSGGIPASDLELTVQNSLDAADAAAPQATTYTKAETDAAIRAGASLGQMTNLGNGRYEYTGALNDASTQTYPREEA